VPRRAPVEGEHRPPGGEALDLDLAECRSLAGALLPGVDFTREIALTRELAIGNTTLIRDDGELIAFALWHSTPLAAGRPRDELRVLKLVARDSTAFDRLLETGELP